jgi:hypothetical protein
MKNLLSFLFIASCVVLITGSCSPEWQARRLSRLCSTCAQSVNVRDSIRITYTERDTFIYTERDTSVSVVVVKCDSSNTPVIVGSSATPSKKTSQQMKFKPVNKTLEVKTTALTEADSLRLVVFDKQIEHKKEIERIINATVPYPPYQLKRWDKFFRDSGYFFWGLIALATTAVIAYTIGRLYVKVKSGGIL